MKLNGDKVIVSGGSRGIGMEITKKLLSQGADVFTFSRSYDRLENLKEATKNLPGKLTFLAVDMNDKLQRQKLYEEIKQTFRCIDVLVNSLGGIAKFGNVDELTEDDFQEAFDFNVLSMVGLTQTALPFLKRSKKPRIINISSISGVQPAYHNPHYSLTKAATINFSKYLANVLSKERILVNVICPGPVHTGLWEAFAKHIANENDLSIEAAQAKIEEDARANIPLGRIGLPQDISGLVAFLASEEASWITGSCFHVSGGKIMSAF